MDICYALPDSNAEAGGSRSVIQALGSMIDANEGRYTQKRRITERRKEVIFACPYGDPGEEREVHSADNIRSNSHSYLQYTKQMLQKDDPAIVFDRYL